VWTTAKVFPFGLAACRVDVVINRQIARTNLSSAFADIASFKAN
jgi:hypothetical protein